MTQFDSIVYLDSDTIVLDDLSHLHELVAEPWRTGFEFATETGGTVPRRPALMLTPMLSLSELYGARVYSIQMVEGCWKPLEKLFVEQR